MTAAALAQLAALAVALLARLGFPVRFVRCAGPLLPRLPLVASWTAWCPLRPLGLPGRYTPMTGGEP